MGEEFAYEAFISYCHGEKDEVAAKIIQGNIEGYKIPKALQEQAGRARLGKCFRDQDELGASSSLSREIDAALAKSRYLIVICSYRTPHSLWVNREVERFIELHGRDRVLAVLIEGEPADSFPASLRANGDGGGGVGGGGVGGDGVGADSSTGPTEPAEPGTHAASASDMPAPEEEPLAADLRPAAASGALRSGGRSASRRHGTGALRTEILRIIAALIGCQFDDLVQRQNARARRRKKTIGAAIAAAVIIALVPIGTAVGNARTKEAYSLLETGASLWKAGFRTYAVNAADDALSTLPALFATDTTTQISKTANMLLEAALWTYPASSTYADYDYSTLISSTAVELKVAEDGGVFAARDSADRIHCFDLSTGNALCTIDAPGESLDNLGIDEIPETAWENHYCSGMLECWGSSLLCCIDRTHAVCYDTQTGNVKWSMGNSMPVAACVSADGNAVYVFCLSIGTPVVVELDAQTGSAQQSWSTQGDPDLTERMVYDAQTNAVFVTEQGEVERIDLATGESVRTSIGCTEAIDLAVADGMLIVESTDAKIDYLPGEGTGSQGTSTEEQEANGAEAKTCTVRVEGFDAETLDRAWACSDSCAQEIDAQSCFLSCGDGSAASPVLAVCEEDLLQIDGSSGTVTFSRAFDSAVMACIPSETESTCMVVTTADGSVYRCLFSGADTEVNQGGALDAASIGTFGANRYVFASASMEGKICVIRTRDGNDIEGREDIPETEGIKMLNVNCDQTRCYAVESEGVGSLRVVCVDFSHPNERATLDLASPSTDFSSKDSYALAPSSVYPDVFFVLEFNSSGALSRITAVNWQNAQVSGSVEFANDGTTGYAPPLTFGKNLYICANDRHMADDITESTVENKFSVYDGRTLQPVTDIQEKTADCTEGMTWRVDTTWETCNGALVSGIALSDGNATAEKKLALYDAASNTLDRAGLSECKIREDGTVSDSVFVSPDGSRACILCEGNTVRMMSMEDGSELWKKSYAVNGQVCLAFSDTGKKIFFQDADGTAAVLDADTGNKEATLEDAGFRAYSPVFSADEKSVAVRWLSDVNGKDVYNLSILEAAGTDLFAYTIVHYGICITADESRIFCWDPDNALFLIPKYNETELRQLAKEHLGRYQTSNRTNVVTPTVMHTAATDELDIEGRWYVSGEFDRNGTTSSDALTQVIENQSVWVSFNGNHTASFRLWGKLLLGTWEFGEKIEQSEGSGTYLHTIVFDSGGSKLVLYYADEMDAIIVPSLLNDGLITTLTKQ